LYLHLPDDGNLICSPLSIYSAMSMTSAGARGKTAQEMSMFAGSNPDVGRLIAELEASRPDFQLHIASALWAKSGFKILPEYQNLLSMDYGCACFSLDFSDTAAASRRINDWVAQQTSGKIPAIFSPGSLPASAMLVLTNAVYFHADWELPFLPQRSAPGDFHVPNQADPVQRMMMHEHGSFSIMHDDQFDALELPYQGNTMGMLIVLPTSSDGLKALESKLSADFLDHVVAGLQPRFVEVSIPKFSFAWQTDLRAALMSMGIRRAFDAGEADFSGIDGSGRMFLSDVVHKAYVSVDEKGTEAAAATGAVMMPTAIRRPQDVFIANHPFLFIIRDRSHGTVLFAGRVSDPVAK
jgi:serpin B